MYRAYAGQRLDLEIYKGKLVNGYLIDIYNDDDTAKDLSIYDNVFLKIFQKQHGTEVETFETDDGLEITDNTIGWTATDDQTDLRPKYYWGECFGELANGNELIFYGVIQVI